ncbi:sulfate transmembrane transporter [Actinidia rufa]|uniref:Sulfate transmembrane transporter n=1 Tax=Actinidia rufa TaxID=165716 RepID=A0A7J0H8B7_9ERIC|nr:sulfate transmembrane transporter [Actinidia rufa]
MEEGHPHPPTSPPRSTVAQRRRRVTAVDIPVAAIWKVERWGFSETAEAAIWEVGEWGFSETAVAMGWWRGRGRKPGSKRGRWGCRCRGRPRLH